MSEGIWVPDLTMAELKIGTTVGVTRNIAAMKAGLKNKGKMEDSLGWSYHIEGACGEIAVAKHLGVYYDGHVNEFKRGRVKADVAGWEIRTRSRHYYDLLIQPDDDDDAKYLLVTGVAPSFCIRGWAHGHEAKKDKWLKTYTDGRDDWYFMPQSELRAFES